MSTLSKRAEKPFHVRFESNTSALKEWAQDASNRSNGTRHRQVLRALRVVFSRNCARQEMVELSVGGSRGIGS